MRIEAPDVIEAGQQVAVSSFGYWEGSGGEMRKTVDSLVSHLKPRPRAQKTYKIEIFYEDVTGAPHESVMRMGQGGIRLLHQDKSGTCE